MPPSPGRLREVTHSTGYSYLLSLPADHGAHAPAPRPLLLFLHGIRERGTDVWDVTRQGLPRLLHDQPGLTAAEQEIGREVAAKFIVVAPQCPRDEVWDTTALLALLDDVAREFRPDAARTFVTGLSMGGFGTWTLGMRHPGRFAAIAPVCGGGRLADVRNAVRTDPSALRSLAVWAFHGAQDRVVPLHESERMIEALKAAGGTDVNLTIYPEAQHDAWTETYSNRDLYRWLLARARSKASERRVASRRK